MTLRLYQNLREQSAYNRDSIDVPLFLLQEQTELESQIRDLEIRLDKIIDAAEPEDGN